MERRLAIGSSDAPKIMETSHLGGPWDVWGAKVNGYEMTGGILELGLAMEPCLRTLTEARLGVELEDTLGYRGVIKSAKTVVWQRDGVIFRDTADGIVVRTRRHRKPLFVVETKLSWWTERGMYGEEWTDEVPAGYKDQCVFHCGANRVDACILAAQFNMTAHPLMFMIKADPARFEEIQNRGVEWWNKHVVGGEPPMADASAACARYQASKELTENTFREATAEEQAVAERWAEARRALGEMAAKEKKMANEVRESVGPYAGIQFEHGASVSFRPDKNGNRILRPKIKSLEVRSE